MAPDAILFGSIVVMLVAWVLFGGDAPSRILTFGALATTGIWLLALATWNGGWQAFREQSIAVRFAAAVVLLVPLGLLVPLPPFVWQSLPGRGLAGAWLDAAGFTGRWHPATLSMIDTTETALLCWWLFGLVMALQLVSTDRMRAIYRLLLGLAALNIVIGLCQVVSRGDLFDFYNSSHRGFLIGFFANKNHAGLFTAIAVLTGYAAFRPSREQHGARTIRMTPSTVTPVLLVIFAALLATNSRAGLLFGLVSLGFAALLALDVRVGRRTRIAAFGVLGALCVAAIFASTDIATASLERFGAVGSDVRWVNWQRSLALVGQYFPVGAGIGTFPTLFIVNERLAWLEPTYFNHAHNDYLEQMVELGAFAPVLWIVFLTATVPAAVHAWHNRRRSDGAMALIGAAIILLFLVHSAFDYPLRRPGTAVVFAVAIGALLRARRIAGVAPTG